MAQGTRVLGYSKERGVVRICAAECRSALGDKRRNIAAACAAAASAAACGADLISFPELYITGYDAGEHTLALAEPRTADIFGSAARNNNIHIVYGYPEIGDDGRLYNSANLIGPDGRLIGTYRKTHLFGDEELYFASGTDYPVFDTAIGRIGMMICYDVEFPEPARMLSAAGARLIVSISANMAPYYTEHRDGVPARARENSVYISYSNYTGRDKNYEYCGQSVVVDRTGRRISGNTPCSIPPEEPCSSDEDGLDMHLIYADIEAADLF